MSGMDGLLDDGQRFRDAGAICRRDTLHPRRPRKFTPFLVGRALYRAPRAFERLPGIPGNTAPCKVRAPAAKMHSSGFTRVVMQGSRSNDNDWGSPKRIALSHAPISRLEGIWMSDNATGPTSLNSFDVASTGRAYLRDSNEVSHPQLLCRETDRTIPKQQRNLRKPRLHGHLSKDQLSADVLPATSAKCE